MRRWDENEIEIWCAHVVRERRMNEEITLS